MGVCKSRVYHVADIGVMPALKKTSIHSVFIKEDDVAESVNCILMLKL